MIGFIVGGSILFFCLLLCGKYRDKLFGQNGSGRLWMMLGGACVLRIVLAAAVKGYSVDMGCFTAWSELAFSKGIAHMYAYAAQNNVFLDYPPGYMYILYIIGMVRQLFSLSADSPLFWALLKLPATLFDLATAYLIWKMGRKRGKETLGMAFAAIYALHPAWMVTASMWGQVDAVFVFFLVLAFWFLDEKRHAASTIVFAVALLVKPQALIFAPVYLWYLWDLFRRKEKDALRITLQCIAIGVLVFAAGILPFSVGQNWNWIFKLYFGTLSSYPYATLNMFNVYALLGGNFVSLEQTMLGIPYHVWGMVLMAAVVVTSAIVYRKHGIFVTAAFLNIGLCLLGTKMHERYMLPGLALLLIACLFENQAVLRHSFGLLGFTAFLNIAYVLFLSWQPQPVYHIPAHDVLMISMSAINLAAWIPLTFYCFGGKKDETVTQK